MIIRSARIGDAQELIPRIRLADLRELEATTCLSPQDALSASIVASAPAFSVIETNALVIGMFGIVPDRFDPAYGCGWLVGADALTENPLYFLRLSRMWIRNLHRQYRVIWNRVDARNEVHIRWLKWCGFFITRRIESYGVESRPFWEFVSVKIGGQLTTNQ